VSAQHTSDPDPAALRPFLHGSAWSASLRRGSEAELREWLDFALACADAADPLALRSFGHEQEITAKPDGSFVTATDRAIEELVRGRIADRFPDHGAHGEEFGLENDAADVRWYIDPIDGTHNYMRGIPLFGFLLGVERDGELQVGVMSAPALGQRWYAARGLGAWSVSHSPNAVPRRLKVSAIGMVADAQILFRSVNDMHDSRVAAGYDRLIREVWRERGFGDFWGYALVAGGAAEAMMEQRLGPWDLAAPWVVVEEAGGVVTDFEGRRSMAAGEALASNGTIHKAILDRLRGGPASA
jgi:histidinol-phosphatase